MAKMDSIIASDKTREILLNPDLVQNKEQALSLSQQLSPLSAEVATKEISISYDNWTKDQILDSILPDDAQGCSGFSLVGHILHLNLKEHLLPYKKIIGQVLLDKSPTVSVVVNKTNTIDNSDDSFRSFSMEVLAGDGSMVVTVKENKCTFTLDFSKVYWNPRLSTEHERISNRLSCSDFLFDVMAGVGPFAIPSAKRKCKVYANDLNPISFEYLQKNAISNKVEKNIECFNMDGKEFIKTVFKNEYLNILKSQVLNGNVHITMNLPSIATKFLDSFCAILSEKDLSLDEYEEILSLNPGLLPQIHVYLFIKEDNKMIAKHLVATELGYSREIENINSDTDQTYEINSTFEDHVIEIVNVRRVAPNKMMFRVSFKMPIEALWKSSCKRLKVT